MSSQNNSVSCVSVSNSVNRRRWLQHCAAGIVGVSSSGWLPALAQAATNQVGKSRHCILLWMTGGPSQIDTFDMKPGHDNGGEFKEIATSVPGIRISEHLPKLAKQTHHLSIVRGVSTREGDHGRGTYLMRTGQTPGSPVKYPAFGSSISKEIGDKTAPLPNYVSINSQTAFNPEAFGPGFLGPKYAPATVGGGDPFPAAVPQPQQDNQGEFAKLKVDNLTLPAGVSPEQDKRRWELWQSLQSDFLANRNADAAIAHDTIYRRARRMMTSKEVEAFDLSQEENVVREAYGRGRFGQGCLLARRLVERGVPFVEVALGPGPNTPAGWDTHQDNFASTRRLCEELDSGWSTLMTELADRGLLQNTTIVWMGEFGRTPQINGVTGRDHFPTAWTCVFGGSGINGGSTYGKTSDDGMEVVDGKVSQGDLLATLVRAVGIDPEHENMSQMGRPIKIAEGNPIKEILS